MSSLFSKDEDLLKSAPILGARILSLFESRQVTKLSVFDLAKFLRDKHKATPKGLYYGMIFLYSLEIIEFEEPYISLKK